MVFVARDEEDTDAKRFGVSAWFTTGDTPDTDRLGMIAVLEAAW